ncbi:MAG: 4-hydroxy-tetrahydrodipicolinate synthase [Saccharospirillaceae bacterium]|nr:4-hydroxy-tetrahydrodipicolinate synthase [Pseudomonadales bacterium]NRB80750.1 4-hydroxy-tetrahydrodipicolinate synthase [Saccharospirillaceae bacterium]
MITGSIVALVTPMLENGDIHWESLDQLIEIHIDNGTNAIVAVGTTGESATLSVSEHKEVIKFIVDKVNKRIPVIAGAGANSTSETIELTKAAKEVGADACLLVTPYYNKPTQEGLFLHHQAIAQAVEIDQILYNVPGRTAVDMNTQTVIRLSKLKNIVGIKEATGDIKRAKEIIAGTADDFALYSGDDATAVDCMLAGAKGDISVTANISPKAMSSMCEWALKGNEEMARRVDLSLQPLHEHLFCESNPIPVKWALNLLDLIPNGIRLPLTQLDVPGQEKVTQALIEAGVI